jgi:hypothetical protein
MKPNGGGERGVDVWIHIELFPKAGGKAVPLAIFRTVHKTHDLPTT